MSALPGVEPERRELAEAVLHLQHMVSAKHAGLVLRDEQTADQDALIELYTEFRWQELAQVPWPEAAKREFLAEQCRLQTSHYQAHYAGARFLVIEESGGLIGRLYLHRSPSEYRLMDIMLFERARGRGIGHTLIAGLCETVHQQGVSVTLHVERDNPARDFYVRRGFEMLEDRGVYHFMRFPSG